MIKWNKINNKKRARLQVNRYSLNRYRCRRSAIVGDTELKQKVGVLPDTARK